MAGHAVLLKETNLTSDSSWSLLDFQRGEPPFYIQHVRTAVELAALDPEALLILSGGATRLEAGPRTEAHSYFSIAEHYGWWGHGAVSQRTVLEDFARDSFENLLFGICRFREYAGVYPGHVSLVSWAFKEQRFGLHREAIGYPAEHFHYVGPNNPRDLEQALRSERTAIENYRRDPYSSGEQFRLKRIARNPFRRQHGYSISCPELASLLAHPGPDRYPGPWPW